MFLDRDGTLNRSIGGRPPNHPREVELLPGVVPVLLDYAAQGWLFVIVSNQGGVASGYMQEAAARAVQQQVVDLLPVPVAASYLCPHMAGARVPEYDLDCPNRKPKPGFILTALEELSARAEDALFVGDSNTDRQAADAAGVAFRWADLFFGRPIDRGYHRPDGHWVQVRQVDQQGWSTLAGLAASWALSLPRPESAVDEEYLALVAQTRATPVGWLSLMQGESAGGADLAFGVDPNYRESTGQDPETTRVGALLFECALDWARAQPGLERLCVSVLADNLPVSRLCCRYGFQERRSPLGQAGSEGTPNEWIQLDCFL